jgi:hypothetical protein
MPHIRKGQMIAFFAFDVGYEISLVRVSELMASLPALPISRKKQTPAYLQYTQAPQILLLGKETLHLGEQDQGIEVQVQATLFDFGAISISYRLSLADVHHQSTGFPLEDLPALSQKIFDLKLETQARIQVSKLLEQIQPAITRPEFSGLVEDYYVFVLESLSQSLSASELLASHSGTLAKILRFDTEALSDSEKTEALSKSISYYADDLVVIDWNTAIVYDEDYLDTLNVLELLNIELLEARYMDEQLDRKIRDYEGVVKNNQPWFLPFFSPARHLMQELSEIRIECALLADRVDNALKLIGDLYLARIHDAASERFCLHEWDVSLSRKLDIIDRLYQLLNDRVGTAQAHTLELVIILLILIEIVLGLMR